MKIKNLTLGLMVIGSLSMVGCDDIQDANSALEETTKKVEEKAEPEKKEVKKEEEKTETEKKEVKKEEKVENGQCYDCGEYYPVDKMEFNGRSYHCGCVVGYCELCNEKITKGNDHYVDGTLMCKTCLDWHNEEMEQWEEEKQFEDEQSNYNFNCDICGDPIAPDEEQGIDATVYCPNCYNNR